MLGKTRVKVYFMIQYLHCPIGQFFGRKMSIKKESTPIRHSIETLLVDVSDSLRRKMGRYKKEVEPILPIRTLWIGDLQIEELFMPYQRRMEELLKGEIEFISNPQEALGILEKKAENGSLPDILVIKSYMSGMKGLWLIKAIKDHPDSRVNSLPICVLAGYLEKSEKDQLEDWKIRTFNIALIKENLQQIRQALEESKTSD